MEGVVPSFFIPSYAQLFMYALYPGVVPGHLHVCAYEQITISGQGLAIVKFWVSSSCTRAAP